MSNEKHSVIDFRPFCALRPPNELASTVSCPPYNYLNEHEARLYAQTHQNSFIHVSRPEVGLPRNIHAYQDPSGQIGKQNLVSFTKNKLLIKDQQPAFYIYQQRKNNKTYTGIFGTIAIKHYLENRIKAHEKTLPKKVDALCRFTQQENAHVDPALLIYQKQPILDAFIQQLTQSTPTQLFDDKEGANHALWLVKDKKDIHILQQLIGSIHTLYIADGHHRTTAAAKLYEQNHDEKYSHYLVGLFAQNQVDILAYNRIIKHISDTTTSEKLLQQAKQHFDIKQQQSNSNILQTPGSFDMLIHNNWYHLKPKAYQPEKFDLQALFQHILEPTLHITSSEQSKVIEYVSGHYGKANIQEKCSQNDWPLAFMLQPVSFELFKQTVDTGAQMPPKTTWFEPKVRPGMIVQILN